MGTTATATPSEQLDRIDRLAREARSVLGLVQRIARDQEIAISRLGSLDAELLDARKGFLWSGKGIDAVIHYIDDDYVTSFQGLRYDMEKNVFTDGAPRIVQEDLEEICEILELGIKQSRRLVGEEATDAS